MYNKISLTKESLSYVNDLETNFKKYKVTVQKINDATIIDCGIDAKGSVAAGLLFIKISLGGLASVNLDYPVTENEHTMIAVSVETSYPVLSTLGCQAASWNVNKDEFFGMVCGPGRALAQKPSKIYKLLEYKDSSDTAILCIESDKLPTPKVIDYLAEKCNVEKKNLKILMIKTNCLVEYLQMAARAIEIGVFRLVEQLGFSKEKVQHAIGSGLVPPLSDDANISNDRVNNALIYGTRLYLVVKSTPEDNLEELIEKIPSNSSSSYGKKFLELFEAAGKDFGKMDLSILAPSEVIINDIRTGKLYQKGKVDANYLF
ncbi:MAG: methenyltetrahydromethanopterin cyclohydrolase [Candidatus Heimdallarchaeota archaeon]